MFSRFIGQTPDLILFVFQSIPNEPLAFNFFYYLFFTLLCGATQYLPAEINLDFASKRWQQLVKAQHNKESVYSRKQLEVCVFSYVVLGLSRGDLFVEGSEAYADYRKQLLSWEECKPRVAPYCEAIGLPTTASEFVAALRERLEDTAKRVDAAFLQNSDLTLAVDGTPHLKRVPGRKKPDNLDDFRLAIKSYLPERHLLDMLKYAHYRIGYTRHFGPPSGHDPKLSDATRKYLMAVFGYGCGLGAKQTAQHTRGFVTRSSMKRINDQHVTTEKLEAATRDIINEYARFQLPFIWGDGKHAVADGTHIKLLDNNLLGQHHFRYGEYGAIAYHHVSDTYIAIFSHFIAGGVWEAVYILDGLLKNDSAIQPDTLFWFSVKWTQAIKNKSLMRGASLLPK